VSPHERARRRKNPKNRASGQALWRMVARVCGRAGVRVVSPHQLRHGFANRFMRESGRDVGALKGLMGHSRIDTTQLYTDEIELTSSQPRSTVLPLADTHKRRQIRRRLRQNSQMSSKG
jgi:integrase